MLVAARTNRTRMFRFGRRRHANSATPGSPDHLCRTSRGPPRATPVSAADPVRILHAPSDRGIKGTRYVLAAVERLKAAGYPVELLLLEGVPHDRLAEFCDQADIAIDQLMIGAYGTVSIEMMAKGVPVVCRIREDLRQHYPSDLPVLSAGPEEIFDVLERLLRTPESWPEIGGRGVEYVRREHEMHQVARRILELYGLDPALIPAAPDARVLAETPGPAVTTGPLG